MILRLLTLEPLNTLMRAGCIAVYLLGAAGAAGWLPPPYAAAAQYVALFVLAAHTLELVLLSRHLRLYAGSPVAAVALAVLFGSLHWFPLLERARAPRRD